MKKSRQVYRGGKLFYDDEGRMFAEAGNARIYLNGATVRSIEGRRRKKKKTKEERKAAPKKSFVFHKKKI